MTLADDPSIAFIMTRDRAASEAFYRDTLGLRALPEDPFAAVFNLAGIKLRITEAPDHTPSPHPVLGWQVGDIASVAQALANKGVVFIIYEGMDQDALGIWTAPAGRTRVAFFPDPDGNVLSLTQA